MTDRYIKIPANGGWYDIWELDDQGNKLRRIADLPFDPTVLVGELNRLAQLADDTANLVRFERQAEVESLRAQVAKYRGERHVNGAMTRQEMERQARFHRACFRTYAGIPGRRGEASRHARIAAQLEGAAEEMLKQSIAESVFLSARSSPNKETTGKGRS